MYENHVIFQVGEQCYSINSLKVKTIERAVRIEPLPGAPGAIEGIGELRGEFHPICSLHRKFNVAEPAGKDLQYLFVETGDGIIGVITDAVRENAMVDTDELIGVPTIVKSDSTDYVSGIVRHKGELITMIDPDKILTREEAEVVKRLLKQRADEEEKREAELKAAQEESEAPEEEQQ